MRTPEEIRHAIELLAEAHGDAEQADSFKYGFLIGKLLALEWVIGDAPGSDISQQWDFEDWRRELRDVGDELQRRLNEPPA